MRNMLYLRTVYWFNLIAGGSIGHTAGVINALARRVPLEVISNDTLPEVAYPVHVLSPVKLPFLRNEFNELLYSFKVIMHLRHARSYDAIYQRYSGFSFAGAYLSRFLKIPLILEFNSSELWKVMHWTTKTNRLKSVARSVYNYALRLPVLHVLEWYNLSRASIIVVVSQALKETLVARGVGADKIIVNPNGVDVSKYSPSIDGTEVRNRFKLNGKAVVGFIGTFGQWHGVVEMCRAIIRFYELYPRHRADVVFLLIGDGVLLAEAKRLLESSSFKEKVIFCGAVPQNEGAKYLAACDICLSPHVPNPDGTRFFGSPTKLFEYMAMGKPIIASALEQIAEILEHGETAYLVKPGDVDQLASAISALVEDKRLRERIGSNAREEAVCRYSWDGHVGKILERLDREAHGASHKQDGIGR